MRHFSHSIPVGVGAEAVMRVEVEELFETVATPLMAGQRFFDILQGQSVKEDRNHLSVRVDSGGHLNHRVELEDRKKARLFPVIGLTSSSGLRSSVTRICTIFDGQSWRYRRSTAR